MTPSLTVLASVFVLAFASMAVYAVVGRRDPDADRKGTRFAGGLGDFLVHWFMWVIAPAEGLFLRMGATPDVFNFAGLLFGALSGIFLGLGLNTRDWGDLVGASLRGEHSNDAYAIMQRPAPQADILDRAMNAPLIVLHQKGLARLTQSTIATIEAHSQVSERQARYTIYRSTKPGASK